MFDQQQSSYQQLPPAADKWFDIFFMLVSGLASCLTPLSRRNFGRSGMNAGAGFLIYVLYLAMFPEVDSLFGFFGCWLLAALWNTWRTASRARKGVHYHSRYSGDPWIGRFLPWVRKESVLLTLEWLLWIAFGLAMLEPDRAFGNFILTCAIALLIKNMVEGQVIHNRLLAMRDAELEQIYLVDRFRQGDF